MLSGKGFGMASGCLLVALGFAKITKENSDHPPNYTTEAGPSVAGSVLDWFASETGCATVARLAKLGIEPPPSPPALVRHEPAFPQMSADDFGMLMGNYLQSQRVSRRATKHELYRSWVGL